MIMGPDIAQMIQGGGVVAFAGLTLYLLKAWREDGIRREAKRDDEAAKRETRYTAVMEKQVEATSTLAASIASYAASQQSMALEVRDLSNEVRQIREDIGPIDRPGDRPVAVGSRPPRRVGGE